MQRISIKFIFQSINPMSLIVPVLSLLFGFLFAYYRYGQIDTLNATLLAMIVISLQIIANIWWEITNYRHNYINDHNLIITNSFQENIGFLTLFILITIVIVAGVWLVIDTTWVVLIIGLITLLGLYLFAGTKHPLKLTIFHEFGSALFSGFAVLFLAVYINNLQMKLNDFWEGYLLGMIPFFIVFNIILANNISRFYLEEDKPRKKLIDYLQLEDGISLFVYLYVGVYVLVIVSVALKILPLYSLSIIFSIPFVYFNIRNFFNNPLINQKFNVSIKNKLLIIGTLSIGILLGILAKT